MKIFEKGKGKLVIPCINRISIKKKDRWTETKKEGRKEGREEGREEKGEPIKLSEMMKIFSISDRKSVV